MTLPSSGPLSLNDLNVEFGIAGTTQLSISQSFAGTYAQYGAINRNTLPGQNIYAQFATIFTDFALDIFYDYNDLESNYWSFLFDSQNYSAGESYINILLAGNTIYSDVLYQSSVNDSLGYVDTTYSATTGNDLDLQLGFSNYPNPTYVDISVTDPDTGATIFSDLGADPNVYKGMTNLATVYGYQRFYFEIYFYD
jgi:hypothetical protein